jgi:exonuclease III
MAMATLNVDYIRTNELYVGQLLEEIDILCIQEHWLHNFEQLELHTLAEKYDHICEAKSTDDDDPVSPLHRKVGHGGVATFWKAELDNKIEILPDGNNRTIVIKYSHEDTSII